MGLFFRLKIVSERKKHYFTMQITIRGQESYLLDFNGDESLEELRARICERENSEDILLYVSGKPLSEEGVISSLENCAVDVTVPLLGGKVHVLWLVLEKFVDKHLRLMPNKRRRKEQDELKDESNITEDLLTYLLHSEEDVD